jgi:hypothetical protein
MINVSLSKKRWRSWRSWFYNRESINVSLSKKRWRSWSYYRFTTTSAVSVTTFVTTFVATFVATFVTSVRYYNRWFCNNRFNIRISRGVFYYRYISRRIAFTKETSRVIKITSPYSKGSVTSISISLCVSVCYFFFLRFFMIPPLFIKP